MTPPIPSITTGPNCTSRNTPAINNGQRVSEGDYLGQTGVELPCGGSAKGDGPPWACLVEAQAQPKPDMSVRMLVGIGLLVDDKGGRRHRDQIASRVFVRIHDNSPYQV